MPPPFAHPLAYLTTVQPTPYPYPQPGVLTPPAFGPPTPLPSPPPQPHLLPPPGQVFTQQGAPTFPPSQRRRRGNLSDFGNQGPNPSNIDSTTANHPQGSQPKPNRPLRTNKPCSCCGVYGHYTHDCPLLPQLRQMWDSQATNRGKNSSPTIPPTPATSQPTVFTDPFPQ